MKHSVRAFSNPRMKMDNLTETNTATMLAKVEMSDMVHWSDDRRKEFCATFAARTQVARFILLQTAKYMMGKATEKQYISFKHESLITKGLGESHTVFNFDNYDPPPADRNTSYGYHHYDRKIGGRNPADLTKIAQERGDAILKNLPPLRKAIEIIDADAAKMLDEKDKILATARKVREDLDEITVDIDLDDLDGKMTLDAFRAMVKDRDKKAKALAQKLVDLNDEGTVLEKKISKRLYAGLPGLSDAVIDAIRGHIEQAYGLDTMNRRVAEQVTFGDSEAALELLRHFEADETKIADDVQSKFAEAMNKLKASMKKPAPEKAAKKAPAKKKELRA